MELTVLPEIFFGQSCVCDFCDSSEVSVVFYCPDFVVTTAGGVVQTSVGDWMACGTCADFIFDGDVAGLTERALVSYEDLRGGQIPPDRREATKLHLQSIQEAFFRHYHGSDLIDEC